MTTPHSDFKQECLRNAEGQGADESLRKSSLAWICDTAAHKYTYNFSWMGRPIIQFPQDMIAMQELIWDIQPDLIIETGIAHGGSLVYYASLLELLGGDRLVVGIDIDIRAHNRQAIESHPMAKRIRMVEGSALNEATVAQVKAFLPGRSKVMVLLDSNHTHDHVLRELELYSPMVTKGSYLVVFDTIVEQMPKSFFPNRPWGPGDNPWTAVQTFLEQSDRFEIDKAVDHKLLISVAPDGYLKCVKD